MCSESVAFVAFSQKKESDRNLTKLFELQTPLNRSIEKADWQLVVALFANAYEHIYHLLAREERSECKIAEILREVVGRHSDSARITNRFITVGFR